MATRKTDRERSENLMRIAVPIPCKAPFDWLPAAVQKRSTALRKKLKASAGVRESGPAEVVRETLWEGLDWLDAELAHGRSPLRPLALASATKKQTPRVAYSLLGKYMELPHRLEATVTLLNEIEPDRFSKELFGLVQRVGAFGAVGDMFCARWEPPGKGKLGVQMGFSVSATSEKKSLAASNEIDRMTRYDSTWSKSSLARALLARGLQEYAPTGFEQ